MKRKPLVGLIIAQLLGLIFSLQGFPLTTGTHAQINEYVTGTIMDGFSLDSYLKDLLGIEQGVDAEIQGVIDEKPTYQTVSQWFRLGGVREDSPWYYPNTRSRHHYHDPLSDQGFSGLGGTGLLSGESSIMWSQSPVGAQTPGGHYSWHDVRGYYYAALTAVDQETKERQFAETFRGLGHLMHLVQDLSVPEHARDDGHYLPAYEAWVAGVKKGVPNVDIFAISPVFFVSSAIGNPNPLAPVPVANLFDTNQYALPNPDPSITLQPGIGLSEYTNANFLSPDTMFTAKFPYPSADECIVTVDSRNRKQYLASRGAGQNVDYLAVVSRLYYYRTRYFPQDKVYLPVGLDPFCYEEYASYLIPRAIGYSASLLKYFFRGELGVQGVPVYTTSYDAIKGVKLRVRNVTPSRETMGDGTLSVVCRYETAQGEKVFLSAQNQPLDELLYGDELPLQFDFEHDKSVPIDRFGAMRCRLAFRGTLGHEEGAVAGRSFFPGKFDEPWDKGLTGNYPWEHTTAASQRPEGETYNAVVGGRLIKDNIRWQGYATPRSNSSVLHFKNDLSPNGLLITPQTRLQFKIDALWVNVMPPAPPGSTTNLQAMMVRFSKGRVLQISQLGHFMYYSDTTAYVLFLLGVPVDFRIYEIFAAAGIEVPEPFYLEHINFLQQLWNLQEPSTHVHHQHVEVDYIRIVEPER